MQSDQETQRDSPDPRTENDDALTGVAWPLRDGSCVLLDADVAACIPRISFTIFRAGCGLRRPQIAERGRPWGEAERAPLARIIMQAKPGEWVLHVNGDVLDCRRGNMRLVKNRAAAEGRLKHLQDLKDLERARRSEW